MVEGGRRHPREDQRHVLDEIREGRKDMPIDKRADLVNACVQQTLKEHPPIN